MDILALKNSLLAIIVAFLFQMILCPVFIPILKKINFGQYQREEGPQSHLGKQGTPIMGGVLILAGMFATSILLISLGFLEIAILIITFSFALIGFWDDFIKVSKKRNLGLRAWQKLLLQMLIALGFGYFVVNSTDIGTSIIIPFTNGMEIDLGNFYIPFILIVIVGTVNAVNFTDGLDGLASGVTALVITFFATLTIGISGGLTSMSCAVIGSLLGFLLFNAHPARIFMGDTGSLALGGFLAGLAISLKMPLFLVIVGIIYVLEVLSVIIQVSYYKLTKKRFFKMSPLHHHFELSGWKETKVVAVFFVITAIACLIGYLAI